MKMKFGWRANRNADGFEQGHGRFTMEVFWFEPDRVWRWAVWEGKVIVDQNQADTLEAAKTRALMTAGDLERMALKEDQKFR